MNKTQKTLDLRGSPNLGYVHGVAIFHYDQRTESIGQFGCCGCPQPYTYN